MSNASLTLTSYSKPGCVQCNATYRALDKKSMEYSIVDISQDALAREFTRGLGFMQAPVLVVTAEDGSIVDKWSGFNPNKIEEWADQLPIRMLAAA